MKEQQTRQVVQELEQLLAKAEEEATKARQVRDLGIRFGIRFFLWMGYMGYMDGYVERCWKWMGKNRW